LNGVKAEPARLQPLCEQVDRGALAGGIPAFKQDDAGDLRFPARRLEVQKPLLQSIRSLYSSSELSQINLLVYS
jgi:hypothetical protein